MPYVDKSAQAKFLLDRCYNRQHGAALVAMRQRGLIVVAGGMKTVVSPAR
jgi:hypothetical protein